MKLLRSRLSHEGDPNTSLHSALEEYMELSTAKEKQKEQNSQQRHRWSCFDCGGKFEAEGFGACATDHKDVFAKCVSPGFWVACIACQAAHVERKLCGEEDAGQASCVKCMKTKHAAYFDAGGDWCRACEM